MATAREIARWLLVVAAGLAWAAATMATGLL